MGLEPTGRSAVRLRQIADTAIITDGKQFLATNGKGELMWKQHPDRTAKAEGKCGQRKNCPYV